MQHGAIILCGGKSSRMGQDKAMLPFGPELMLQRVVRLVGEVVVADRIVVVAAEGQSLPKLPNEVSVVHDARPERGPLEGLAAGLRSLQKRADAVFATSCDVPLLAPALVRQLFDLLAENEAVAPYDGEYYHPLSAVYRLSVLSAVERLLAADCLRASDLLRNCTTLDVPLETLRSADPDLDSLTNCNSLSDYQAALGKAGISQ